MHSGALLDGFREGRGEERHLADLRGLAAVRVVGGARRARIGRGHGEDGQRGSAICQQVGLVQGRVGSRYRFGPTRIDSNFLFCIWFGEPFFSYLLYLSTQ